MSHKDILFAKNDFWIHYYDKLNQSIKLWTGRRDLFTTASLTVTIGFLTAYIMIKTSNAASSMFEELLIPVLPLIALVVVIRLFILTCIAYAWIQRSVLLAKKIEILILQGDSTALRELLTFDHNRYGLIKTRKIVRDTLLMGHLYVFIMLSPFAFYAIFTAGYCVKLISCILFASYLLLEIYLFAKYPYLKQHPNYKKFEDLGTKQSH